jgi:hypothetical protein
MVWVASGAIVGAAVGFVVYLLVGGPRAMPLAAALTTGAVLGALASVLWKSLLRPVLLALIASPEAFEREYGAAEEKDVARESGPRGARLSGVTFQRNPTRTWGLWGALLGAALGSGGGAAYVLLDVAWAGGWAGNVTEALVVVSSLAAILGAAAGALAATVWMGLARPLWLALFFADDFRREYGTPEEQGIVRRTRE